MMYEPKSNKRIDGMRISTFVDSDCKKIIEAKTKSLDLSITAFLEGLIKNSALKESDLERIFKLTELNQDLYVSTNATFSNINQIAFALNTALKFEAKEVLSNHDIMKNLTKELKDLNFCIREMRILFLEFLFMLNSGDPTKAQKYKNALKNIQRKIKPILSERIKLELTPEEEEQGALLYETH